MLETSHSTVIPSNVQVTVCLLTLSAGALVRRLTSFLGVNPMLNAVFVLFAVTASCRQTAAVVKPGFHPNASACVSCGFHLGTARNASDCIWMETGLYPPSTTNTAGEFHLTSSSTELIQVTQRSQGQVMWLCCVVSWQCTRISVYAKSNFVYFCEKYKKNYIHNLCLIFKLCL